MTPITNDPFNRNKQGTPPAGGGHKAPLSINAPSFVPGKQPMPGFAPLPPNNPMQDLEQRIKTIETKLSTALQACPSLEQKVMKMEQGLQKDLNDLRERTFKAETLANNTHNHLLSLGGHVNQELGTRLIDMRAFVLDLQKSLDRVIDFANETSRKHGELVANYDQLRTYCGSLQEQIVKQNQEIQALRSENQRFSEFIQTHSKTLEALQAKTNTQEPAPESIELQEKAE